MKMAWYLYFFFFEYKESYISWDSYIRLEAVIEISFSDHSQKREGQNLLNNYKASYKKITGPSIFSLQVMKGGFLHVRSRHPSACQLSFQLKFSFHLPAWNTRLTVRNRLISSLTRSANHSTVMLAGTFCFLCTVVQQQIMQTHR